MSATDIKIAGNRLPIVKYVYLVEDASDAIRMGSTGSNVYTNAQLAWNAAVAIITANPAYRVVIQVGVTTAAGVGGISMSGADSFFKISIVGMDSTKSVIGDITLTGSITNSGAGILKNITVGNVTTNNNTLLLQAENTRMGNISYTAGGNFQIKDSSDVVMGTITLTGVPTFAASLSMINSKNFYITSLVGTVNSSVTINILNSNPLAPSGSSKGNIVIGSVSITGMLRPTFHDFRDVEVIDTFTYSNTATAGGVPGALNFENCKLNGAVSLTASSAIPTVTIPTSIVGCTFVSGLTCSGARLSLTGSHSSFLSITNLSANSVFSNCTFRNPSIASPLINGIGAGCQFYNCTFVGGSFAIDNGTQVKVTAMSTVLLNRTGANVWIVPEDVLSNTITTTNAVANNNAQSINIPNNAVVMISSYISARNTATGVGNGYVLMAKARNIGGVVTLGTISNTYTQEDAAAWDATYTVVGTTVRVTVTGAIATTIDWAITSKINS